MNIPEDGGFCKKKDPSQWCTRINFLIPWLGIGNPFPLCSQHTSLDPGVEDRHTKTTYFMKDTKASLFGQRGE